MRRRSKGPYLNLGGLTIEWRYQAVNMRHVAREVCLQPGISYDDALNRAAKRMMRPNSADIIAMNGAYGGHNKIWDVMIGRGPKGGRAFFLYPNEFTIALAFDNSLLDKPAR